MKERPILFKGEMVRAILEGRKTQTRRVVKIPIEVGHAEVAGYHMGQGDKPPVDVRTREGCSWRHRDMASFCQDCSPFGFIGDRLWVKETFLNNALDGYEPVYFYRADSEDKPTDRHWKPSIFMPRKASRIALENFRRSC
jgi:hypothetical protein